MESLPTLNPKSRLMQLIRADHYLEKSPITLPLLVEPYTRLFILAVHEKYNWLFVLLSSQDFHHKLHFHPDVWHFSTLFEFNRFVKKTGQFRLKLDWMRTTNFVKLFQNLFWKTSEKIFFLWECPFAR